jgi:hypothetical protein
MLWGGDSLNNDEIRWNLLVVAYHQWMKNGQVRMNVPQLAKELGISEHEIGINIRYLYDRGLLLGSLVLGTIVPLVLGIAPSGIDFVEHPEAYQGRYAVRVQTINIDGDVYGQVAQGTVVKQLQEAPSYDEIRAIIDERKDIDDIEKAKLSEAVSELEKGISDGSITKRRLDQLKDYLTKYDWLWSLLADIIRKGFGL